MNRNLLHHSIKVSQVPIQPSHIKPGVIMAQMEKQFQEEETKVLCITHISTFAITILPTLDIKKKILRTYKLGYSDIYQSTVPAVWICWVGRKSRKLKLQYVISCCEGYHTKIHSTAVTTKIEMSFFLQLNL